MIRKTLESTKKATFSINVPHPDPKFKGMPFPNGTGFFVSRNGHFMTAVHVINNFDISKISLEKSDTIFGEAPRLVNNLTLVRKWENFDICLLQADFQKNKDQDWLKNMDGFPYLEIEFEVQEEGTPVYSFGYPLSDSPIHITEDGSLIQLNTKYPRTTSAVISSNAWKVGFFRTPDDPVIYVIDKALNFGNSGGPIIVQETGKVIAICHGFQTMQMPQQHMGQNQYIIIPSLYSIIPSLSNIKSDLLPLL